MSRAAEPLKPVYGIWGEDRAKIDRAVQRLVARVAAEGGLPPDRFDASATPAGEVAAACAALSLAGIRLVLVRDADRWKSDDAKPLVQYLDAPNPATCLALIGDSAPTQKLTQAIQAAGQVLRFGPDPKAKAADRARWFAEHVVGEGRRLGATIPVAVARQVVARVGEDAGVLALEAAKLAAYAGDEPVTREMVALMVPANPEARAFLLGDAIVARDAARAYGILGDLAAGDERAEPIVVQATLARHFRGVAAAQAMGAGATPQQVSDLTGLRGFPAQKAVEHARELPAGAGERAVVRLSALELDLRVSSFGQLGRSADDGRRMVLELAARDLLGIARG